MAPSLLIIGATGNTGRGVVQIVSDTIRASHGFSEHRILAQTRSANSGTAKELANLPNVKVVEINWPGISTQWLREHDVERSSFHYAALKAGVKYVVRISTTALNVRPDCLTYYPRIHWAIEALLDTPAYENMHWTSVQPKVFLTHWLAPAVQLIKKVQSGGKPDTLRIMANESKPVGSIDPHDVSIVIAKLLLEEDTAPHNKARYVLNGPETITGAQMVAMVEERIGAKVENVVFRDNSQIDAMMGPSPESKHLIDTIKDAGEETFNSPLPTVPTSREILELAPPKGTPASVLAQMLQ